MTNWEGTGDLQHITIMIVHLLFLNSISYPILTITQFVSCPLSNNGLYMCIVPIFQNLFCLSRYLYYEPHHGATIHHEAFSVQGVSVHLDQLESNFKQSITDVPRCIILFVCFVALGPKSTAMVMAGRSVQIASLFPGQA